MMRKRPIVWITCLYMAVLFLLLVIWPDLGEKVFGYQGKRDALYKELGEKGTLTGRILSIDPSAKNVKVRLRVEKAGRTFDCILLISEEDQEDPQTSQELMTDFIQGLQSGPLMTVSGSFLWPQPAHNPGEFDLEAYCRLQRFYFYVSPDKIQMASEQGNRSWITHLFHPFWMVRWRFQSRRHLGRLISRIWPQPYSGIVTAMLTGDRSSLDQEQEQLFSEAGISHILAISGLHLTILTGLLMKFLRLHLSKRKASLTGNLLVWAYTWWCGGSFATMRAASMLTTATAASLLGREKDDLSSMALSMLFMLLIQPYYLTSASFWMTYAALYGMRFGSLLWMPFRRIPYPLRKWTASSVGVSLFLMPFSLWFYFEASPFACLINLWVVPAMQAVILTALMAVVLGAVWLPLSAGPAALCRLLLKSFQRLAALSAGLRLTVRGKPSPFQMILFAALAALAFAYLFYCRRDGEKAPEEKEKPWMRFLLHYRYAVAAALLTILLLWPWHPQRVTFLSVGQGDCAVIESKGSVILVDAGPSYDSVIKPYLKLRGVSHVDAIVLSHPDLDHIEGALALAADPDFTVGSLIMADEASQDTDDRIKLKEEVLQQKGSVWLLKREDRLQIGSVFMEVLSPGSDVTSINDSSLVVKARIGSYSYLFCGDISQDTEKVLLSQGTDLSCDILKAAHHGSETSSSYPFLKAAKPCLTVISCGRRNRYGHPSPKTLDRFRKLGLPYMVTAWNGAVWVDQRRGRLIFHYFG